MTISDSLRQLNWLKIVRGKTLYFARSLIFFPNNAEGICQVHIVSVHKLCAMDYTSEQIEAWIGKLNPENHVSAIEQKEETMFVAKKEEKIIGFSSLFKDEIRAVYVHFIQH